MVYRHPPAFLLGLEGVALLRAQAGDGFDRAFTEARIEETRTLLDRAAATLGPGTEFGPLSTAVVRPGRRRRLHRHPSHHRLAFPAAVTHPGTLGKT